MSPGVGSARAQAHTAATSFALDKPPFIAVRTHFCVPRHPTLLQTLRPHGLQSSACAVGPYPSAHTSQGPKSPGKVPQAAQPTPTG